MNAPPASLTSKEKSRASEEIRGPEIGPAYKRDMILQRVRAARKRLSPRSSDTVPRLH